MQDVSIRTIGPSDLDLLLSAPDGLFDTRPTPGPARAFLADPSQIMVMAFDGATPVGFASGTILRHPDKAASLFVNEVGVIESRRRRGIGRRATEALMADARARFGATEAWLATEADNAAALALYRAMTGDEGRFHLFAWGFRWEDTV